MTKAKTIAGVRERERESYTLEKKRIVLLNNMMQKQAIL